MITLKTSVTDKGQEYVDHQTKDDHRASFVYTHAPTRIAQSVQMLFGTRQPGVQVKYERTHLRWGHR